MAQYPYFFLSVGTRSEKIKTNNAVKLPSKLKSLELKLNVELKKLTEFPKDISKEIMSFCKLKWSEKVLKYYQKIQFFHVIL